MIVLHVIQTLDVGLPYGSWMADWSAMQHKLLDDAQTHLQDWVKERVTTTVTLDIKTRHGYPRSEIVAVAEEEGVDLIVIGTHGRTGLSHVVMGSVAERVVRTAPSAVLTVRPADAG